MNYLSIIFSGLAIALSIYSFFRLKRENIYSDLDGLYLELLKLAIKYPKFVDPKYTNDYERTFEDDMESLRYEIYAYISWNILETIYDRKDEVLTETWFPVIIAENKLHRKWFDNSKNHHKFKERFRKFINDKIPNQTKGG